MSADRNVPNSEQAVPWLCRVKAYAEIKITVDVDFGTDAGYSDDVAQAVQDAIGHTGAVVQDVTEWEQVP